MRLKTTAAQRRRDRAFGRRLARARAKDFPTQALLASAIGVAPSTIYRLERGLVSCSRPVLDALCRVLQCKPEALTRSR